MRAIKLAVKGLRSRVVNQWWRVVGTAGPDRSLKYAAEHPDVSRFDLEPEMTLSYPRRKMAGDVDRVARSMAELDAEGVQDEMVDCWDGKAEVWYPKSAVRVIERGSVISRQGVISTEDGVHLTGLGGGPLDEIFGAGFRGHIPRPQKFNGAVLVMSSGMSQRNYFHWTIEMLGQLRLVEAAGLKYDYIAAPARHGFARQSLELLGAQPSQIVSLGRYTHVKADRLIVPSMACTFPCPASVAFLRERMRIQPWSHYQREDRLRLYISRPRRRIRHVVNEKELLAAIRPLGFEPIELDNLPLKQQIQLFQRAEAIVGPHGAGFTNLVYARPDTAVFEIAPASRPAVFFHYLAEINDQRYMVYFGQPVQQKGKEANIQVDSQEVYRELARFLEAKGISKNAAA